MTDSGVDSELSPSSPDSVIELPGLPQTAPAPSGCTAEELVARLEAETEDTMETDKMETVAALLSLSHSEASRSPASSPEKPLITLLPAHSPDTGTQGKILNHQLRKYLLSQISICSPCEGAVSDLLTPV